MSRKQIIHNKIYYFLFLLLAFLLPIHNRATAIVIILIVLNWMVEARFLKKFRLVFENKHRIILISFSLLFIIYSIGLVYSDNLQQGISKMESKLSLLVFPVIFATLDVNIFSGKQKDSLFYAFAGGCLALSVGLLTSAGLGYFSSRDSMLFYYTWLSFPWHPSYLTMHLVFALSFLLIKLVSNRDQLSRSMTWIHWLLAICFFIVIILLSSKAGIITLGLVLMVLILYLAFYLRKYVRAIGLFILTFFAFWASFTLFPYSVQRFQSAKGTLSNWDQIEPGNTESTAERILIWDAALELGMGHCVFGVGIGDARDELSDIYFKKEIWQAHKLKLNAHNQYLQTFISTGFFGLLVLLGTMLLPAGFAIRNKHYFYFLFILITGFNFIFESMLCRQAGIVFFAYFNALLWYFFVLEKTSSGN